MLRSQLFKLKLNN